MQNTSPPGPKRPWITGTVVCKGRGASEGRGFEKDVWFILVSSLGFLYLFFNKAFRGQKLRVLRGHPVKFSALPLPTPYTQEPALLGSVSLLVLPHRQAGPVPSPALLHNREHIIHTVFCLLRPAFLLKHVSGDPHSCLAFPVWTHHFLGRPHQQPQEQLCPSPRYLESPQDTLPREGFSGQLPSPRGHITLPRGLPLLTPGPLLPDRPHHSRSPTPTHRSHWHLEDPPDTTLKLGPRSAVPTP